MSFYADYVLPHLINAAMRQETMTPYRRRVVSNAAGRVLEIGVGSGVNLALYPATVTSVIGLDPSAKLLGMARQRARANSAASIQLVRGLAERLPLQDNSVDSIVMTWTLCSVADVGAVLREVRRVLKPDGSLHFVEHGLSPDASVRRWQDRLTPYWKRIAGGCHLNRSVREHLDAAGFVVTHLKNSYLEGPRPFTYMYEGRAVTR